MTIEGTEKQAYQTNYLALVSKRNQVIRRKNKNIRLKVIEKIKKKIASLTDGSVFRYRDVGIQPEEYAAAAKGFERLVKEGAISRVSTGVFFKPKKTPFGLLKPNESALLQPYLFENNKRVAYITGTALYNKMGLTTQVPKNIKIASRNRRIVTSIGNIKISPAKIYLDITDANFHLMELLDVLKDINKIPDSENSQTIRFILKKVGALTSAEREKFIKIAGKYPPRVRALAGAILNEKEPGKPVIELKKSINPLTAFNLGITKKQLTNIDYWHIH